MGKRVIPRNLVWKLTTEKGVAVFRAKWFEVQSKGRTKHPARFATLHLVSGYRGNRMHLENLLGNSGFGTNDVDGDEDQDQGITLKRIGRNTFVFSTRDAIDEPLDLMNDLFTFAQKRVQRKLAHANGRRQTRSARDRQFVRDGKRTPVPSVYI